ncbi:hypothetical protein [Candidatus Avelusimicrobium aviculae]|uniref:hypothetical protein n=1 Tax=Candidatus Avelusimicrobium aviculae TaxID=3416206 RepID=UPI003D10B5E4
MNTENKSAMFLKQKRQNKLADNSGQATIEYVLMLGTVVTLFSAFIMLFNKDIVRIFFSFIGMLMGY